MNKQYQMVKEFHERFGHLVNDAPTALTAEQRRERYWFMHEENGEFLSAETVVEQADAMIDLIYFATGTLVNMGVEPDRLFRIVHEANMAKLWPDGKPRWRENDGKVLKPPTWTDPAPLLQAEIERQGNAAAACDPNLELGWAFFEWGTATFSIAATVIMIVGLVWLFSTWGNG